MKKYILIMIAIFIFIGFWGFIIISFFMDSRDYSEVKMGEKFGADRDGEYIKLPNNYAIQINYGENTRLVKIKNEKDILLDLKYILDKDIKYYYCDKNIVYFKIDDKRNTKKYIVLNTDNDKIMEYKSKTELIDAHNVNIKWEEA